MNWEDYKNEKLKNPDFKNAYDELEEEFNLLNEKLTEENKKIPPLTLEQITEITHEEFERAIARKRAKQKNLQIA